MISKINIIYLLLKYWFIYPILWFINFKKVKFPWRPYVQGDFSRYWKKIPFAKKALCVFLPVVFMLVYHYHTIQKIFYNRSTNSATFCALQWISLHPLPFFSTQIIHPFLNSRISANRIWILANRGILILFYVSQE